MKKVKSHMKHDPIGLKIRTCDKASSRTHGGQHCCSAHGGICPAHTALLLGQRLDLQHRRFPMGPCLPPHTGRHPQTPPTEATADPNAMACLQPELPMPASALGPGRTHQTQTAPRGPGGKGGNGLQADAGQGASGHAF